MLKVHKTAICVVPPQSVWPQLQEIRVFNDRAFVRWPPHINLLYPFHADEGDAFAAAAARCTRALSAVAPFKARAPPSQQKFLAARCCSGPLKNLTPTSTAPDARSERGPVRRECANARSERHTVSCVTQEPPQFWVRGALAVLAEAVGAAQSLPARESATRMWHAGDPLPVWRV